MTLNNTHYLPYTQCTLLIKEVRRDQTVVAIPFNYTVSQDKISPKKYAAFMLCHSEILEYFYLYLPISIIDESCENGLRTYTDSEDLDQFPPPQSDLRATLFALINQVDNILQEKRSV